jgi:hypothetical protein
MKHLKKFENFYLQPDSEEMNNDSEKEDLRSLFAGRNTDDDGRESNIDYTPIPGEPDPELKDIVAGRMPEEEEDFAPIGHDEEEGDDYGDDYNSSEEEEGDSFIKRFDEAKKSKSVSYKKSGLKRPDLADRNKNKKIEGWEKAIAKKIEKSMDKKKK